MTLTRRQILKAAGAGGAALALGPLGCSSAPDVELLQPKALIPRQEKPYNAEPRLDELADSWITPFRLFYVRSHGTMPTVDPAQYRLTVEGRVEKPLRLSLEELDRMPKTSVPATLQCAGNRRREHSRLKTVAGVQWDAGAIGTAEWRGPRLAEILSKAGVKPEAKHVWFEGLDAVTLKDQQILFGGGVPLDKAMRPETLVAIRMNSHALSPEHGFPARTIVPGFIGARSVKWLSRIIVSDHPSDNNFVARDYKLFPPEATAETVRPEEFQPIYEFVLSSAILSPLAGQTLKAGKVEVRGYAIPPGDPAWRIAGVEVSADAGATWTTARLSGKDAPFTWKLWSAELTLGAGSKTLVARARDSGGKLQPEKAPWNFKGYLYNGWHQVPVTVA